MKIKNILVYSIVLPVILVLIITIYVIVGVRTGFLSKCPYEPTVKINNIEIDDCCLRCDYEYRLYEYGYNLTIRKIKNGNKQLLLKGKIHCGENKFTFGDVSFNNFLFNKDTLNKEITIDLITR